MHVHYEGLWMKILDFLFGLNLLNNDVTVKHSDKQKTQMKAMCLVLSYNIY